MNERFWNENYEGDEIYTKIRTISGAEIGTIYSSFYKCNKPLFIPNKHHYDYYESKWDEYIMD